MKYRPLCTSYLTDARSQLEEIVVREERPMLVIEPPVIGGSAMMEESSSSESECEKAIEKPLPPRRRRRTTLFSLNDDASFAFIQQDDAAKKSGRTEKRRRGETSSDDDMSSSLELEPKSNRDSTANHDQEQNIQDEIESIDSSSDEEVAVKPFQLVTKVSTTKMKRAIAAQKSTVDRHPLEDTDDEDDCITASDKKKRMKKRLPSVVNVSLVHSPVNSILESQSQEAELEFDEATSDDNGESMVMEDDDIVRLANDDFDMKDAHSAELLNTDTTSNDESDKDHNMRVMDGVVENLETPQDIDPVVVSKKKVLTEYLPVDPSVIAMIMQGLQYSRSRKRIAAYPHNHYLILPCAATSSARATFWALGPARGLSSQSIVDAVLGDGGMQRILLRLAELPKTQRREPLIKRDLSRQGMGTQKHSGTTTVSPPKEDQRLALHNEEGNASDKDKHHNHAYASVATRRGTAKSNGNKPPTTTALPDVSSHPATPESSRALVLVNPSYTIPPVWLDVCNAIMVLQRENPEEFASLASYRNPSVVHGTAPPTLVEQNANGRDIIDTSAQDETPRSKQEQQPRIVSDEKLKKSVAAKDKNSQSETAAPQATRHGHKSEQEKLDRQERKRQRKEKRERKRQKKAERRERKRKAREQSKDVEPFVESRVSSLPNDVSRQQSVTDKPVCTDQIRDTVIASPDRKAKRQKTEETLMPMGEKARPTKAGNIAPAFDDRNSVLGKRATSYEDGGGIVNLHSKRDDRDSFIVEDEIAMDKDPAKSREKKRRKKDKKRRHSSRPAKEVIPIDDEVPTANNIPRRSTNEPLPSVPEGVKKSLVYCDTATAPASEESSRLELQQEAQHVALCSESFFEEWTDAIALLASGQWYHSVCPQSQETDDDTTSRLGPKIQLIDTLLLEGDVDIELPGHAVIVHRLSSWEVTESANIAAKQLVRLTALEVYKSIDVIICADTDITPSLASTMAYIQNAVISQGLNCSCSPSFQVTAPNLLAPVVASRVLTTQTQGIPTDSFINASMISDIRVQERARFLRSIAPSLSVCGALQCLMSLSESNPNEQDPTRRAFQRLISSKSTIDPKLFGNETLFGVNASAFRQLAMAINAPFV